MRFRDFEITIHGDFGDGDSEQDFRAAIAQKLGALGGGSERDHEAKTIEKIEAGDARWSPPLQQHLDIVKQSLDNQTLGEVKNQIIPLDTAEVTFEDSASTNIDDQIKMCESCGRLMLGDQVRHKLGESSYQKIQKDNYCIRLCKKRIRGL